MTSPPQHDSAQGAPPSDPPVGSRSENLWMFVMLLLDLASTPWHLLMFAFRRSRARRDLATALEATQAAPLPQPSGPEL